MKPNVENQLKRGLRAVVNRAPARSVDKSELWIDIHNRKHEYGRYLSAPIAIELERDGRSLTIWAPDSLRDSDRIEIQSLTEDGDLVFLLASHSLRARASESGDDGRGILIVARKQADGSHATVVWHEFFPQTLEILGLRLPTSDQRPSEKA